MRPHHQTPVDADAPNALEGGDRRRLKYANYLLLALSLLVGFALFEVFFRFLDVDFNPNPYWYFHSVLGWQQKPGHTYDYVVAGERVHVEYNSAGFRDAERAREKPAGTKRIVVIGDSFSEAVEVNLGDTFQRRLEAMLNASGSKHRWEVINLGVGDFGNTQAFITLKEFGLAYSPDIVVGQIFPLNDICNNGIALFGMCKSENDPYRPYFVKADGDLRLTTAQPLRNFLRRRLAIFGILERAYLELFDLWPHGSASEKAQWRLERLHRSALEPLLHTFVNDAERLKTVTEAWKITELILEKTVTFARQRGIPYVALVIPFEARVGSAWQSFTAQYSSLAMIQDYPEKRLGTLFQRLAAPAVMMKGVYERHQDLFRPTRGGHLNPEAHRLAAEALYQRLRETKLVR